jgi:hypothetical protein
LTCHSVDTAPLNLNIPNCRKNKTLRVTGNKKLMLGNRKDPTFFVFSRNSDNGSTIQDQLIRDQNRNRIYFSNTALTGPFVRIPYEILIDSKSNKMEQRTSQNGKGFLTTLIYTQGSRIQKEKLVLKMVNEHHFPIFFCQQCFDN